MKTTNHVRMIRAVVTGALAAALVSGPVFGQSDTEALERKVRELQEQLDQAKRELDIAKEAKEEADLKVVDAERQLDEIVPAPSKIRIGNLTVGGAIRANYTTGSGYDSDANGGQSRAWEDGGDFGLETFRINLDYLSGPWVAKVEYRWYDSTNFLHTGWVAYNFDDESQVQVGVNRVPFGPGPYGVSQSWLFDQHYYVGLADDMDLGVKYTKSLEDWRFDFAYYARHEGQYTGTSKDSARYSYDIADETGDGYEERNQLNLRAIYAVPDVAVDTNIGVSLQYGQLDSQGPQDDGDHYAASVHMVNKWGNYTLASQLTYYNYDIDDTFVATNALGPAPASTAGKLVTLTAFDFGATAAAEAWIPAVSLSYFLRTPGIEWLDYVIPYAEYSVVVKEESSFNDSELIVLGAAWAHGGWYIQSDYGLSNGNEFVGADPVCCDRLGANADDEWVSRFNINFGYYF